MITKERANELFVYKNNDLYWKINKGTAKAGSLVGSLDNGYRRMSVDGKMYLVHRVIFFMAYGYFPKFVDHKDGNTTNNNIDNLRAVTPLINSRNSGKRSHNSTGYTGVALTCKPTKTKDYFYYTALWKTLSGEQRVANYSIEKLGDSAAFLLAVTHRQFEMEQLHNSGAGYTERHGL